MKRAGVPVRDAIDSAVVALRAGGCETPRLDAELLAADVLGVQRVQLLTDDSLLFEGAAARALQAAVRRRAVDREPVAYITGRRHFRRLELHVDRRVLIPRPETELLVEVALAAGNEARVLDMCTGSGAVALAVKDERPDLSLTASDISLDALELARENARRLGLDVAFTHADLFEGIAGDFDLVLANPPYVADGERPALAPEIARHEPPIALFAGADGLDVVRRLLQAAAERTGIAAVALEVGAQQAAQVCDLARSAGFAAVSSIRDLAGIERVVVAGREPEAPGPPLLA